MRTVPPRYPEGQKPRPQAFDPRASQREQSSGPHYITPGVRGDQLRQAETRQGGYNGEQH